VDRLPRSFWCGLLAGVGLGLVLAAALVELGLLAAERRAFTSLAGAVVLLVGVLLGYRTPKGK
jgi:hypothetical protein